jgi:hypothetical protein
MRVASNSSVSDLDPYGHLQNAGFLGECTRRYCHRYFDASWSNQDAVLFNDPLGCARTLCGDVNSAQVDIRERAYLCRMGFFQFGGDPSRYIAQGEADACKELRNQCEWGRVDPLIGVQNRTIPFGDRLACLEEAQRCDDLRLASLTLMSREFLERPRPPVVRPLPGLQGHSEKNFYEILRPIVAANLAPKDIKKYPEILAAFSDQEFHAQLGAMVPEVYLALIRKGALDKVPESVSLRTLELLSDSKVRAPSGVIQLKELAKSEILFRGAKSRDLFASIKTMTQKRASDRERVRGRMPANARASQGVSSSEPHHEEQGFGVSRLRRRAPWLDR